MNWDTIIVSDLHLGTFASKAEWFLEFVDTHPCRTLVLNGDIVDGWALNRGSKWKKQHTKVISKLLKISATTNVIWIRGNHDEFLSDFIGFTLGGIEIREDYIVETITHTGMESIRHKYFVFHGDIIDIFMLKYKWLSKIGSVGYDFSLWLNTQYNRWRKWRGKTYYSISKPLKQYVKSAANYINDFESAAAKMASRHGCDGVICGHIHQDADRYIDGIRYINSGDWIENMTAILIDNDGNILLWKKSFDDTKTINNTYSLKNEN